MWFGHTLFLARLLLGRIDRLGRAGARRSRGAAGARARQFWPQTLARACDGRRARPDRAGRHSLRPVHRRRPACCRSRSRSSPRRPASAARWSRIGLGRLPEETAPPPELRALGAAGGRTLAAADRAALSMRASLGGRCAASCARCASTMAIAAAAPRWTGSMAHSCRPGDLVFDVGAHVGDRIARVPPARRARRRGRAAAGAGAGRCALLYGRDRAVDDRAGRGRPQRRHDRAEDQHRQSDRLDRVGRFRARRRRRARLGGPSLDANRRACR